MNPFLGTGLRWMFHLMADQFLSQVRQADRIARNTLAKILAVNGKTAWGREHGLDGYNALESFQRLPVHTYEDFQPYIERAASGETNVLTGDPVTYFAVTSGTTGAQKLIPVTRRQTRSTMSTMLIPMGLASRAGLVGPIQGRYLQIMTEQISGTTKGGIPKGAASSGGLRAMEPMLKHIWTSPYPVIQVQDQATARYLHLLFALEEERLWALAALFPSTLLDAFRDLHMRTDEFLRDLADGTITAGIDLDLSVRRHLQSLRKPCPERARRLVRLREQGHFTARDIWPRLDVVFTVGSGSFRFYVEQLRPYLGGAPVVSAIYAASEATVGIGMPDRPGYIIAPQAAYHEFLPISGGDRPLSLGEVEEGQEYEVVLTTFAGLWRYRLGDRVRVVGRYGQAPVVEFLERMGLVLNMVGEKTGEAAVSRAFIAACRRIEAEVTDYVVVPDASTTPGRYLLLVEAEPFVLQPLVEAFDDELRKAAPRYDSAVRMGKLGPMAVLPLRAGAFERYRARRIAAGASASQVKVPHVIPDPQNARRDFFSEVIPAHAS